MNIKVLENVLLAPQTTFKIGGEAKFFVEVTSDDEIIEAVKYAKENDLKVFILGGGSNVLINDKGFDGLVIKIKNSELKVDGCEIECDAGVNLMNLVKFSVMNNLSGLEWAAGIPGTVGGAVRGNAGAFGGEIKDAVVEARILDMSKDELRIEVCKNESCKFGYRNSLIKEKQNVLLISAKFQLKKGNREEGEVLIETIIAKRAQKQPSDSSAGSFFKNPIVTDGKIIEKFEHDMEMKMKDNKLPAGWFIDDLGFKGKKIGGAQVSQKHANFIINTGGATCEEVLMLSSFLKQKVRDNYGIQLEEEVFKVGL